MPAFLLMLLLAAPGTIRVRVEGDAEEVLAFQGGRLAARAPVREGVALLRDLPAGAYDLRAEGPASVSEPARGVRAVSGEAEGFDATLVARAAFPVRISTEAGATVWSGGLPWRLDELVLPAGLHRIVVDHPERVSSAERFLRVTGPTELEVPLDAGLAVAGRVTGPGGEPVSGARVEALADGLPARRFTHTDETGRFGLGGFDGDVVSLRITAPGFAARLERLLFLPGSARTRVAVRLEQGSSVTIPVAHGGAPVAGVEGVLLPAWYETVLEEPRMRANHVPVRRRGDGTLRFRGLTPGRRYRVVVQADGYRPGTTRAFVAPKGGARDRLPPVVLERGAEIAGRVVGVEAAAGLTVVCQGPEGIERTRTDRAGRYRFARLDPGAHALWVRNVDEKRVEVVVAAGEKKSFDLEPTPPGEDRFVAGLVLDADNRPLPGVDVEGGGRRARTGADGRFRLDRLPRGTDRLTLRFVPGPGCRALAEDPHLPHVERKVNVGSDARVRLARAGTLWVRLDPGDRALPRARLLLTSAGSGVSLQRRLPRRTREVRVDDLPLGTYVVEVAAPGLLGTGGATVPVARDPAAPVEVALLPGRAVRGTVFLRQAVRRGAAAPAMVEIPLNGGWVTLLDADPRRAFASTVIEPDGSFFLEGLPAGPVLLCATAPGLPVATRQVDLSRGDATRVRLSLAPAGEAAIRVVGPGKEPLPEASVRVVTALGVDVLDLAAIGRFRGVVAGEEDLDAVGLFFRLRRDETGRIAAPFLQPGSYRFLVSARGFEPCQVGVRARAPWTREEIERALEGDFKRAFPGGPPDLARPVRLQRKGGARD